MLNYTPALQYSINRSVTETTRLIVSQTSVDDCRFLAQRNVFMTVEPTEQPDQQVAKNYIL